MKEKTGVDLDELRDTPTRELVASRFVENFVGFSRVPTGVAGPIRVNGMMASGDYYVPFATTEATLVAGYTLGMRMLSRCGGVNTRVLRDQIHISPVFLFESSESAWDFCHWVRSQKQRFQSIIDRSSRHTKLVNLEPLTIGRRVFVKFTYTTGDAMGLNMIVLATSAVCDKLVEDGYAPRYILRSNLSQDKKVSALNYVTGYGKEVVADAFVPSRLLERYLGVTPDQAHEVWECGALGSFLAGAIGMTAQYANGLSSIFIACGQDVASVVNSSIGTIHSEVCADGLSIGLHLPNLVVGTVGGGTILPSQKCCLELMDCFGANRAVKFAEIIAASLLAGEIALCGAMASGSFALPHQDGRKRRGV
ncbi:MAG: 3-hydroxy-3-methylglutaryl-CoA reductase [Candidatus Omnitrophica bacterium]|nr:3-hydroxy-3-methylglutaryl-CoA reductase [Candidatus Omnitrophota bacterium]